jgi:hypothetical protein
LLPSKTLKHSTINLLRVKVEGDVTSEEGFDRDGDGHDGDKNDGDEHDSDGHLVL